MGACFVARARRERLPRRACWRSSSCAALRAWQLRRADPDTTEHEIDAEVERELETGEFRALDPHS